MTPRQRRGVLLLFVAGIGAILVFSLVSGYVSDVRKDVEPKTAVVVLTRAVPELQPIPPDAMALKSVPQKWVGRQALRDISQIGGLVPSVALPAGVELQEGMLIAPPSLQKGQQEISILINADTGVAGKLQPGDTVDVLATFPPDDNTRSPASARTIIRHARIVTIGLPRAASRPGGSPAGTDNALRAADNNQQQVLVPVTFALRPTLGLRLTYAETFASEIRLSLIRRGDETRKLATSKREYTLPPTRTRAPAQGAGR
jgi:pilus assembly protein CpaB